MIPTNEQPYPLPVGWQWIKLVDSFTNQTSSKKKIQQKNYLPKGQIAVVDQGKDLIGGYTNETSLMFSGHLPIILFGDHTRCLKYIDFPFVQGADGVKILKPKNFYLPKAFYYVLQTIEIPDLGYRRHYPLFKNYFIPLPPLDEQQRIVDLLDEMFDKLDEAKTLAQAVVDESELRRAAILHKAFSGELTKLWRDEHGITLDGWQRCQLGDVCNYGRNETVQPSAMKIGKLLIDLEDIEKDSGNLIKQKIFDGTNANSSKHSFGRGDVLYGKLRPYLNKVVIADEDGYCSSEILPLNFGERALNRFAQYVLLSPDFVRYANHNSYGTNMPRLGTRAGRQAPFPLPPLEEQKEIVRVLDDLLGREQRTKDLAIKTLERIELMKKSILARAFRGELDSKNF